MGVSEAYRQMIMSMRDREGMMPTVHSVGGGMWSLRVDGKQFTFSSRHEVEELQMVLVERDNEIERLRGELANATKGPTFYWDDNNLESAYDSIRQAVEFLDVGDVLMLRPIIEQPSIYVRVTEDEPLVFDSEEAAQKAAGGDDGCFQSVPSDDHEHAGSGGDDERTV